MEYDYVVLFKTVAGKDYTVPVYYTKNGAGAKPAPTVATVTYKMFRRDYTDTSYDYIEGADYVLDDVANGTSITPTYHVCSLSG